MLPLCNCIACVPVYCLRRSASKAGGASGPLPYKRELAIFVCAVVCFGLISYSRHCNWVTSEAYSSPSIVLISGWGPYRWATFAVFHGSVLMLQPVFDYAQHRAHQWVGPVQVGYICCISWQCAYAAAGV
jgi:hypothetical protein